MWTILKEMLGERIHSKWLYAEYYCSGVSKMGFTARRLADNKIDKIYSESVRIKFAGQTNRDIYRKSYAHPLSKVDGLANYLGIAIRQEYIQNRRGIGLYPEYEFLTREDVYTLDQTMTKLSLLLSDTTREEKHKIQLKQKAVYREKQSLYNKELRKV
ncbi:hypothetical protein N7527_005471 [Penicillium freii]|nr:hypothetical protein N7527_005471 [Penicillium freii]